ncbi:MAG: threonine synthase [Candidatus Hadarchaeota archaeon]
MILRCLKCGHEHLPKKSLYTCERCGGKIEVVYEYGKVALTKERLSKGRGIWRYSELLPISSSGNIVSLGEGGTPLLEANNLARDLGMKRLYLKDETRNPTGSFKDRMMSVGVSKAAEFDAEAVVTASSGNAAVSLAAYSAKAGIKCYAFVPSHAPESKIAQLSMHGARVVKVAGMKKGDPTYTMMLESWKRFGWHPIPSAGAFNPYHWEGIKTMSYEVCEGLGWKAPDWVIVPTGAGTLLSGSAKGYFEFDQLGIVKGVPGMVCVQAKGSAPIVKAVKEKIPPEKIETWPNPKTIAGGLIDPYPWDADTAIPAIKRSGGAAAAVSDEEILDAERMLARREGIFAEPSGAAGVAGLRKLLDDGTIGPSDVVVVQVTGGGLKDVRVALEISEKPVAIEPKLEQLEKFLKA